MYLFDSVKRDPRVRSLLAPRRIVWQSTGSAAPKHSECLIDSIQTQTSLSGEQGCLLSHRDQPCSVLLDFGREIYGGIQLVTRRTSDNRPVRLRIRFGESASEAMGSRPDNDHGIHDLVAPVPWLGSAEYGSTGFRFVRIDTVDPNSWVELISAHAVCLHRDIPYLGSFRSNDPRLDAIWKTGAYTVHLNMQEFVWDGIKRDRLVWIGDLHPEAMVIAHVFGDHEIVRQSLDFVRDQTPVPNFMNGIFTYSLWWILIQRDWYRYHGNRTYLEAQRAYLVDLLSLLVSLKKSTLPDGFLDWPTSTNKPATEAGTRTLLVWALRAGAELCAELGEHRLANKCSTAAERWSTKALPHHNVKTTAAVMTLAQMMTPEEANKTVLSREPLKGISTFYGYYILQARALAKDYAGCLELIRRYWGAMLDFGATTFWEHFDLEWTKNAARIDELVPQGKDDLHADFGDFCYKGFRHSLCHGWAGGPTAWLSEHVLGFRPLTPGSKKLLIEPHLEDLTWAKGTFPTPYGVVSVHHVRAADGSIETEVDAPKEIELAVKTTTKRDRPIAPVPSR
ncbi:MAG TPA: alpha-L-rhamnosidase C-terminal domain-containing protein [Candidatus Hydrogenedentes bacterium]|nr:alpha-L-rhamnosidase C-terminal domain-containing protein [Candidatus Hydrogenedentota bacterium]HOL76538.1 alpha-L-rhamnosidase C-terminal domain-containing protein [Candidatus Hydrogenedentota bacterium]HPO85202.1 alpha-L-rhamnosidase C-terminal domain-containing protein [Candidatus Hydrogenedentota bacterium]